MINRSRVFLVLILILYCAAFAFDIRGDYRSGDEIGFLTGFEERGGLEVLDWRYLMWTIYIVASTEVNPILPLIINVLLIVYFLNKLILKSIIPLGMAISLLILPTTFYFFNTYLRDPVFMIFSVIILTILTSQHRERNSISYIVIILILFSLMIRPFYGFIYLTAYVLSGHFFAKSIRLLLIGFVLMFLVSSFAILADQDIYYRYYDFFESGHLSGKDQVGVLSTPITAFNQSMASLSFLLSPLYFWFVPGEGIGKTYDILLYIENSFIFYLFGLSLFRLSKYRLYNDRALRMSWLVLVLSFFMASATVQLNDAYRFRLIFIPFLFYTASSKLKNGGIQDIRDIGSRPRWK